MSHDTPTSAEREAFEAWLAVPEQDGEWSTRHTFLAGYRAGQARAATQTAEPCTDPDACNAQGCRNPLGRCEDAAPDRAPSTDSAAGWISVDEDFALIEKLSKVLAGVAVALNGPEPELTRWSYHDLPEKAQIMALELDMYRTVYGTEFPKGWEDGPAPSTDSAADGVIDSEAVFKASADSVNRTWNAGYRAGQQDCGADKLREAVGKLIKAKGRFHAEQNYAALVAAYEAMQPEGRKG